MAAPNGPVTWAAVGSLAERVARVEQQLASLAAGREKRGNRIWVITTVVLAGVVCPLILVTVRTILHLGG